MATIKAHQVLFQGKTWSEVQKARTLVYNAFGYNIAFFTEDAEKGTYQIVLETKCTKPQLNNVMYFLAGVFTTMKSY